MSEEIINRVANSKLTTIDLEDYYPKGKRILFDIKEWLYEGFVLKEKEFRAQVAAHDWSQYQDAYIALICSSEAIVPTWAYMLLTISLEPYAKRTIIGNLEQLETSIYQTIIEQLDVKAFKDQLLIVKGCSNKPIPAVAYVMLSQKLRPVAKSIMYGEACSSVPLFKRK